jgi:hypothetical protein
MASVKVKVVASPDSYKGSTANGVTTSDYGAYPRGAFQFVEGSTRPVDPEETFADPGTLSEFSELQGQRLTFVVTGATAGAVWGSGPYTTDSALAAAAVHAGVLKAGKTGKVTVELMASPDSYTGTTAHGVTTLSYGTWPPGAFKFVK